MKLEYNAPVILTFTLLATAVMIIDSIFGSFTSALFTFRGTFDFAAPLDYVRLFSYTMGHANWPHLMGNFAIILLIGPILEEKYGSTDLLFMMGITALVSSSLSILFFDNGGLGASGIVFMLIMLSSFANFRSGTIPMTFILVALLYLGEEVVRAFSNDNISQFGHIVGGLVGGLFGFKLAGVRANKLEAKRS
jgi:membrane associated rhomboid family serine protease